MQIREGFSLFLSIQQPETSGDNQWVHLNTDTARYCLVIGMISSIRAKPAGKNVGENVVHIY